MFDPIKKLQSICDAPVLPVEKHVFDTSHPVSRFRDYWQKIGRGDCPSWSAFKPMKVPQLLRWMMVFGKETHQTQNRYFLRIQGTSAAYLTRGLHQGKYLDEFTSGECYEARSKLLENALLSGEPTFGKVVVGTKQQDYIVDVLVGAFPFECGSRAILIPAPVSPELRAHL